MAQAAGRVHAEEHAAESGGVFAAGRSCGGAISQPSFPTSGDGSAERVLLCTGKIGHELEAERKRNPENTPAIVFVEQLYPFPEDELAAEMDRHAKAPEFVWVQEEPGNMGARGFMIPQLERLARGRAVLSVNRSASASPATGSRKAHEMEQKTLIAWLSVPSCAFSLRLAMKLGEASAALRARKLS